jgi:hypothetical protein
VARLDEARLIRLCSIVARSGIVRRNLGGVAQAFDLAGITNTVGAPFLRVFLRRACPEPVEGHRGSFQFLGSGGQSVEFVLVALRKVGGALRQFRLEPGPVVLAGMLLLLQQQAEGFFGAQLGDSGEVFHPEAIQHLGAGEFAFAEAERTFDSYSCNGWFDVHVHWQYTEDPDKSTSLWHKYLLACPGFLVDSHECSVYCKRERHLEHGSEADRFVRTLIERQRRLVRSDNPAERSRTLWIAAMLDDRLAGCSDHEIGELMNLVQERFGMFEPEMAVCEHARRRLLLRSIKEQLTR